MMVSQITVDEVKPLGDRRFAVRLTMSAPIGQTALSQTQAVVADDAEAAVQTAKEAFSRWLDKVARVALCNILRTPAN
jgi:hypothetical protein